MKSMFVLLLCLGLIGCATTREYDYAESIVKENERIKLEHDTNMNTWIGETKKSLIASWGKPSLIFDKPVPEPKPESSLYHLNTYLSEGKKVLIYVVSGKVVTGGPYRETVYHSGAIGNTPYSGTSSTLVDKPFENREVTAMTTFIIDSNRKIENWEDDRMLVYGAYYPPVKPSNKVTPNSSEVAK
jgi:hypothetical protein